MRNKEEIISTENTLKKNYFSRFGDFIPKQVVESGRFFPQIRRYIMLKTVKEYIASDKSTIIVEPILYIKKDKIINLGNVIFIGDKRYVVLGDVPNSADGEYRAPLIIPTALVYNKKENIKSDISAREKINADHHNIIVKFYEKNKKYLHTTSLLDCDGVLIMLNYLFDLISIFITKGQPHNYSTAVMDLIGPYVMDWEITYNRMGMQIQISDFFGINQNVGTKIVPLHINDIKRFKNKPFNTPEIDINEKVGKLVDNCVIYNCPKIINWSVFKLTNMLIFSSPSILSKYKKADEYLNILKKLYEAGKIEGDIENIKTYKKKIQIPIHYVEKNLILSNYCMFLNFEDVGITLTDHIIKASDKNDDTFLTSLPLAKDFVLQMTYTLFCLNEKLHIIQNDLHFNNIVIKTMQSDRVFCYNVANKHYLSDGKITFYIIDFGRAIRNPAILINDEQEKDVIEHHNTRLLKAYNRILPDTYVEYKEELTKLVGQNELFHIAKIFDMFYVISNIKAILGKYLMPDCRDFFVSVSDFIINWIRTNISLAVQRKPVDAVNPNKLIIEKFYEPADDISTTTIYCNSCIDNDYGDIDTSIFYKSKKKKVDNKKYVNDVISEASREFEKKIGKGEIWES